VKKFTQTNAFKWQAKPPRVDPKKSVSMAVGLPPPDNYHATLMRASHAARVVPG